jgi:uncharacterized ferritin-like protein (DUF455 family)
MNSYFDFFEQILLGSDLSDKLIKENVVWSDWQDFKLPAMPGRNQRLSFSKIQLKFPKSKSLAEQDKKALAIHSFANHELLAIEMMAAAILYYPHKTEEDIKFKKGLFSALKDEQKHLSLYLGRLNDLGYTLGDFPLNDFFWRQMEKLQTPSQFISLMSLTLEAANLDFAQYYSHLFRELGDEETAKILDIVLEDEITHVALGSYWLKRWKQDKSLWEYYLEVLPWPMTPARSKGIHFDPSLHGKAVSDHEFMQNLVNFNDDFLVTRRT